MSHSNGSAKHSKKAKHRGQMRKARRRRAERREATKELRESRNERMRAAGHPGWVQPEFTFDWPF